MTSHLPSEWEQFRILPPHWPTVQTGSLHSLRPGRIPLLLGQQGLTEPWQPDWPGPEALPCPRKCSRAAAQQTGSCTSATHPGPAHRPLQSSLAQPALPQPLGRVSEVQPRNLVTLMLTTPASIPTPNLSLGWILPHHPRAKGTLAVHTVLSCSSRFSSSSTCCLFFCNTSSCEGKESSKGREEGRQASQAPTREQFCGR